MTTAAVEQPSLAGVQARVAALQQRIAVLGGGPARPGGGTDFSQALSAATSQLGSSAPTSGAGTGAGVVASALQHLGVPYVWGGEDPATGLDCSSLVQLALRENGIAVPRTAAQQAKVGAEVPSLAQARPGDLVVLRGGAHIGIYVGDGKMVHAPKSGDVVKVADVYETPTTIRRPTGSAPAERGDPPPLPGAGLGASPGAWARPAALRAPAGQAGSAAFEHLFQAATTRYGLPPGLLAAVAQVESGFDPRAVSPAGARGLMQIMPGTARDLGVDPMVPAQAVDGAARLLKQHLEAFGSLPLALAAYNAGPGNVRKHDGIPPFAETQSYVRKVTDARGRTT